MAVEVKRFEYIALYIISKAYALVITESIMEVFGLFYTGQKMS